jgi:hypothetical protein
MSETRAAIDACTCCLTRPPVRDEPYPRSPVGCNAWLQSGAPGWGRRCGDRDTRGVYHLCSLCR